MHRYNNRYNNDYLLNEGKDGKLIDLNSQKQTYQNKWSNYVVCVCHQLTAPTVPTFARYESSSQRETDECRL